MKFNRSWLLAAALVPFAVSAQSSQTITPVGTPAQSAVMVQGSASGSPLLVTCNNCGGSGGGGGTSSFYNAAFPTAGTAIGVLDNTGTLMVPLNVDSSGNLKVNVVVGGGGGGSNASVGVNGSTLPTSSTAVGFKDGSGNIQPIFGDTTNGIKVQVTSGGGSNASVALNGGTAPGSSTLLGVKDDSGAIQPVPGDQTLGMKVQVTSGTVAATAVTNTQTTLSTASQLVFSATAGICNVLVCNADKVIQIRCGQKTASVSSTKGIPVPPGLCYQETNYSGDIACASESGTPIVETQPGSCR